MIFRATLFLVLSFVSLPLWAALRVMVTVPDFIEVTKAIGGDFVIVDSFLDGSEDPHFVDAVPSFISKSAKADIVCAVGLELEVGWLPKVLAKSGNAKVQSGGKGFCELGTSVQVIEKHSGAVDRSMGDVHAAGNPHFYLSPTAMAQASKELLRILKVNAPEHSTVFEQNAANFEKQMLELKKKTQALLSPIKDKQIAQYHKEFSYYFHEYGLKSDVTLEEKPGVPPSAARIAGVSKEAKEKNVAFAIAALHTPKQYLDKFKELSNITTLQIPSGIQKNGPASSIEKLQLIIAEEFVKTANLKSNTEGKSE